MRTGNEKQSLFYPEQSLPSANRRIEYRVTKADILTTEVPLIPGAITHLNTDLIPSEFKSPSTDIVDEGKPPIKYKVGPASQKGKSRYHSGLVWFF